MSFENNPDFNDPDELMELAHAIAERETDKYILSSLIRADISGEEPDIDASFEHSRQLGQTALILARLTNPNHVGSVTELANSMIGPNGYQKMAEELYEDCYVGGTDIKISHDGMAKKLREFYEEGMADFGEELPAHLQESFRRQFSIAQDIASENSVNIKDVYKDDDYYYELMRRFEDPVDYAVRTVSILNVVTPEFMRDQAIRMISLTPDEAIDEYGGEYLESIAYVLVESEQAQARHKKQAENAKEAIRQSFVLEATKRYGSDTVEDLLEGASDYLAPTKPLVWAVEERLMTAS